MPFKILNSGSFTPGLPGVFLLLFLYIFSAGCNSKQNGKNESEESRKTVLSLMPGENNPRNSEGDFVSLRDGRILFIYSHYTGTSANDHGNAILCGRYSSDNGETWTDKDEIIVEQEGKMNVMSVSLLRLQNGKIALFYLRKNSVTDCIPMMRISEDEAKTWSNPVQCITDKEGYFVLNNNRVIQLKDGRLLFSVALHQSPGDTTANPVGRIWSYYSDNNGATWQSSSEVPNPESIVTQEPGLVELKNGDILMNLRTMSGKQYFSFSADKGQTWSMAETSNINSPCSPALITRIPSKGDLLLVWNDNGLDQKRTPFNAGISKDEGKTWSNIVIENNPDGSFCYPAVLFKDDFLLLGYYDWSVMGITVLKINLDMFYPGD